MSFNVYIECLKCKNMTFPDMPNGRDDFERLVAVVGIIDALAFNPNMICGLRKKYLTVEEKRFNE